MLEDWHKIHHLHEVEGVPKRELARRFGKDVKTIRRILSQEQPPAAGRRTRRGRRLDPFKHEIAEWLAADASLTARDVWNRLRPRLGSLSERTVRKFVASMRAEAGTGAAAAKAMPRAAAKRAAPSKTTKTTKTTTETQAASTADAARSSAPSSPAEPTRDSASCGDRPAALTPAIDTRTPPLPTEGEEPDLSDSAYFLNRELTWLGFNYRVLHEAEDERTPLLERLKFIAIVSSNLDEFFMKRIGGLKQQVGAGLHDLSIDGRTPQQQIQECYAMVRDLEQRKQAALMRLREVLSERDIHLARYDDLSAEDHAYLREYYLENIFPLVTPQATDPAHPFPFISNLSVNLLVVLRYRGDALPSLARVKVPLGGGTPRLLRLPGRTTYVRLESVMARNLDLLFPGMEIDSWAFFRATRNANTELDEDTADDLLAMIESELRERKFAPVVRLEVSTNMSPYHRGMLSAELGLDEFADVFDCDRMVGMRDLMELVGREELSAAELHDPAHHPQDHPELTTDRNIFHTIRDQGSLLLHHPYQSFPNTVERFLKEAASDPKVRAIKMTLYRTSATSRAIHYLISAARNGKQVAVVVELKARFDEAANIRWANRMEEVGIHVTYGVVGLKTHCKAILVVRQDYDGLRRYAHVGTGNYHAGTARLYSDVGLLTCEPGIGRDLTELFNYLTTGYKPKREYRRLFPAPKLAKKGLLDRIQREIDGHSKESPGLLQFKTNALEDIDVTRALYRASRAGVRVELFIRDTCRLRPGIPGVSENVRVVSVVGRFLEHARIYYFRNAGDEEYYIGSADCMARNLDSRVEIICPVEDPALRAELRHFLDMQSSDRRCAWEMRTDGSYEQLGGGPDATGCQEAMITWSAEAEREATRLRRRRPRTSQRRRRQ